ncbi:MAG: hypothetical protein ACLGH0_03170 [Thermoanaerobaculia bacterium]
MKRTIAPMLVVLLTVTAVFAGCRGRENASGDTTETIAPATPQPAPTGTDAMTQTVDVEHGRSEAEGGGLTNDSTAAAGTAEITGTTETPTTTVPTTTTQ